MDPSHCPVKDVDQNSTRTFVSAHVAQCTVRGAESKCKLTSRNPRNIYISGHALGALPTGLGRPLLGEWMRGGSRGAGGPGSPGDDHWSVSADPFGSRSDAADRKSSPASIGAASSRCVSARPRHPRSRGPARSTHRGGLSTRSCGSEASSFSPTAPRMDKISPRTGCAGLLSPEIA